VTAAIAESLRGNWRCLRDVDPLDPDEEHTVADDQHPDQEQPTVPVEPTPEPTAAGESPTDPTPPAAAPHEGGPETPPAPAAAEQPQSEEGGPGTPPAPAAAEQPQSKAEQPQSKQGPRWVVALVLVLVLGVGGGFLLGRATAPDNGPSSLADAVSQTAKGDLPVGQLNLQELLQSIGKQKGGSLGQILGGGSGSNSDSVGGILGGLLDHLRDRIGNGSSGSSSGSASGAVLGVAAQAAPAGQTGVQVQAVVPGSAAADAGLQANDVITAVNGKAVTSPAELAAAVKSHDPGDQVSVTYTRNGTSATVNVRLGNGSSATTSTTSPATTQPPSNA
jgi:hypothetical protein